jgi:hypothetical protein
MQIKATNLALAHHLAIHRMRAGKIDRGMRLGA